MTIRSKNCLGLINGLSEIVANIDVDTADELPAVDGIPGNILHQGSSAFIIKEGRLAILSGDGHWYENAEMIK